MKKYLLGSIILFISSFTFSQKDSLTKFRLYTSPLHIVDIFSRQMITLGEETVFSKKIGISTEFGYRFDDTKGGDTLYIKQKGYSYRFEIKLYDLKFIKLRKLRNYISIEYRYIKDDYNSSFGYFKDTINYVKLTDNYAILKDIYIGNIKIGYIKDLTKRIYTDLYCGIGFRYRDVRNVNREFDEKLGNYHLSPEYFWVLWDFKEFSGLKFNFTLGFQLGIRF